MIQKVSFQTFSCDARTRISSEYETEDATLTSFSCSRDDILKMLLCFPKSVFKKRYTKKVFTLKVQKRKEKNEWNVKFCFCLCLILARKKPCPYTNIQTAVDNRHFKCFEIGNKSFSKEILQTQALIAKVWLLRPSFRKLKSSYNQCFVGRSQKPLKKARLSLVWASFFKGIGLLNDVFAWYRPHTQQELS